MSQKKALKVPIETAIIFTLIACTLALYNNCGQTGLTTVPPTIPVVSKLSSDDLSILENSPNLDASQACGLDQLVCHHRIYQPYLQSGHSMEKICFDDHSNACVKVFAITYDSSVALEKCNHCTEGDGLPGGKYYYEEAYCINSHMVEALSVELRHYEDNLKAAVDSALQFCHTTIGTK